MCKVPKVGSRVSYIGPTIERSWLPRGAEGVVTYIAEDMPFPFICTFNVADGEDWPMAGHEIEVIRNDL